MMRFTFNQATMRRPLKVVTVLALATIVAVLAFKLLGSDSQETVPAPAHANEKETSFAYTGAGSCSSSNCHGAVSPRTDKDNRIQQDEYTIWIGPKDRHSKAYAILLENKSQQIARNLKLSEKPEKSERCLTCHALSVPPELRARTLDVSDGVSCESCHGPASRWLGEHTTRGWTHDQSLKIGMYDTRDAVKRAEKCLSCHLGDEQKTVDHELIAAGHPDLIFELDTFSAAMPAHWKETGESWKSQAFGAKAWAVGQAVALREGLKQLARRARGPAWPEFAEYDCYACHHDLREPSWRQMRSNQGPPGRLLWNASRFVVFRHLIQVIAPDERKELEDQVTTLTNLLTQPMADRDKLATTASQTSELCSRLAEKIANAQLSPQTIRALLRSISGDGRRIGHAGVRAAEQAVMSIDALYTALLKATSATADTVAQASITKLQDYLERPERFAPEQFAALMNEVNRCFQ